MIKKFIGILFILTCICLLVIGYNKNKEIIKINGWSILKNIGKINLSYIQQNNNNLFDPIIEYEYTIDGTIFKNNKIIYKKLPFFYNEKDAHLYIDNIRDQYKIYGGIDIIYNPQNYSESYLFYSNQYTKEYIVGFIFLFLGIIILSN